MTDEEEQVLLMENSREDEQEFEINLNGTNGGLYIISQNHCHDNLLRSESQGKIASERILWIVAVLCLLFIVAQFIGGYFAHSIAIMTDAGHMISDLLSIILSILMLRLSRVPANRNYSFGYLRAEFIGALMSLFIVWTITIIMVIFATQRIISGAIEVDPNLMFITSFIGISFNLFMGIVLKCCGSFLGSNHGHSHHNTSSASGPSENVNIRAAFIHVVGDFMQSVAVLIASIFIKFTEFHMADPLCTYFFSIIIFCMSFPVAKDIFKAFMEATPSDFDYAEIHEELLKHNGVQRVHNLHIWSLGTDRFSFSVHLVIEDEEKSIQTTRSVTNMLKKKYGFHYSTVQTELPDSTPINCFYCSPLT